jgi:hypothetical protein
MTIARRDNVNWRSTSSSVRRYLHLRMLGLGRGRFYLKGAE